LQGESLVQTLADPSHSVRDAAFCVNSNSYLIRTKDWAFIQHGAQGEKGLQLFDMNADPHQFTNLAQHPAYQENLRTLKARLAKKLREVRSNDLDDVKRSKQRGRK
jgi:arylsulfatase A-like enzyme